MNPAHSSVAARSRWVRASLQGSVGRGRRVFSLGLLLWKRSCKLLTLHDQAPWVTVVILRRQRRPVAFCFRFGVGLVDNAQLDRVAAACAEEGRYEFMLTMAPLIVQGGTGSPINPLAVF